MEKKTLQELIDKGFSSYKIAELFGITASPVRYWLKMYGLKTNPKLIPFNHALHFENSMFIVPWKDVNKEFEKGLSAKDISKKYKIRRPVWVCARDCGILVVPPANELTKNRRKLGLIPVFKHTLESKQKLRLGRIEYLKNNPHNWENKNKKSSIPCEKLKSYLREKGIVFVEEYQPLLHKNRFFSIDIAFPDKMIGVEVNGRQHYNADGSLASYYQERHDLIEAEGWKLYEIPYNKIYKGIEEIVESILSSEKKVEFDFAIYIPKKPKPITKKRTVFYIYPDNLTLQDLCNKTSVQDIAVLLNIPYWAILRHIHNNKISFIKTIPRRGKSIKKDKISDSVKLVVKENTKIKEELKKEKPPKQKRPYTPNLLRRKVEHPTKEKLEKLVWETPSCNLKSILGVSDVMIGKWCKRYEITKPPRGYWAKKRNGKL